MEEEEEEKGEKTRLNRAVKDEVNYQRSRFPGERHVRLRTGMKIQNTWLMPPSIWHNAVADFHHDKMRLGLVGGLPGGPPQTQPVAIVGALLSSLVGSLGGQA